VALTCIFMHVRLAIKACAVDMPRLVSGDQDMLIARWSLQQHQTSSHCATSGAMHHAQAIKLS